MEGNLAITITLIINLVFYTILNRCLAWYLSNRSNETSRRDQWMFCNISCSILHSIVSACWTTLCIYKEPSFVWKLIETTTILSTYLIASSLGYFLYDTMDILRNDGMRQIGVLVHHFMILIACPFALFTSSYHGFAMCALLMEYNSIFLHARRLLKIARQPPNTALAKFVKCSLVLTMFVFRHVLSLYMIYYMWTQRASMAWLPLLIGLSSTLVFVPVNIQLSYKIYYSDFASGRGKLKKR